MLFAGLKFRQIIQEALVYLGKLAHRNAVLARHSPKLEKPLLDGFGVVLAALAKLSLYERARFFRAVLR